MFRKHQRCQVRLHQLKCQNVKSNYISGPFKISIYFNTEGRLAASSLCEYLHLLRYEPGLRKQHWCLLSITVVQQSVVCCILFTLHCYRISRLVPLTEELLLSNHLGVGNSEDSVDADHVRFSFNNGWGHVTHFDSQGTFLHR